MSRKSNRKETLEVRKTGNGAVLGDALTVVHTREYGSLVGDITKLLEHSRRASARSVNAIMTATYWEIGRRIVEFEQKGEKRAEYGKAIIERLSSDLSSKFGRGFSRQNLQQMRQFYLFFSIRTNLPDTVWRIHPCSNGFLFSAPLVGLCTPIGGKERACPPVL